MDDDPAGCNVESQEKKILRTKMSKVRFGTLFLKLDQVTFFNVVYTDKDSVFVL